MNFWKILTLALTIAVALLLYDRVIKPAGEAVLPKKTETEKSIEQQVTEMLKEEAL